MSTLTAHDVLTQLATLVGSQIFQDANPVIISILADIQQNPQTWLNPLTAPIKGAQALVNLQAVLPTLEIDGVRAASQLLQAIWTAFGAKIAAAHGSAADLGTAIANQVTGS